MSIAVTCPTCQARFEITDDFAELPIRCHRCGDTFERNGKPAAALAAGIQAGTATKAGSAQKHIEDEPVPFTRPASPRSPFPVTPLLIVALGILLLLFIMSAGFNVWFVVHPDDPFRGAAEARRAADQAQQMQIQAERAAEQALVVQQQAQQREALLQRKVDDLRRKVDALKEQLEEAKRK